MNQTYRKKLIEVAIPLAAINEASAREKSIRHGHPSTLHLWWARRPLAACRAVLFAQLVDDPSEYVDELLADPETREIAEKQLETDLAKHQKTLENLPENASEPEEPTLEHSAAEVERQRLFRIIEDLVKWENSTNEEVLERARAEIRRCCGDELPPVYDPFSGGGSIPLEAQRLGLPAYGSDLNPVAVMIGKAMIEIPPKFKDMEPIHLGIKDRSFYRNAEGLAEDVKYYGEWIREKAYERIGHLYPKVDLPQEQGGGQATVIAWIWARTVPSPDPAFEDVQVPIASSFLLSSRKGKEAWIEPIVDRASKTIAYEIRTGGSQENWAKAKEGTKQGRGAHFRCLMSDTAITPDYVKAIGKAGGMKQTLMAVVAESNRGRIYVAPTSAHSEIALSEQPDWKPETSLPNDPRNFWTVDYGLTTFGDLFTDRQLISLNTFSSLVHEARAQIETDAAAGGMPSDPTPLREGGKGARAYAEAVGVYLGFAVDRSANTLCQIARWTPGREQTVTAFARQALPMSWDFPEVNPFSGAAGDYGVSIGGVVKGIFGLGLEPEGRLNQVDAQTVVYPSKAVISSDPPYYDNIGYADLSDFFFCWMRPAIKPVYPELFGVLATPKSEELIAAPYRHGGKDAAETHFLEGMSRAIANMAQQSSDEVPATIYYAFKQSEIKDEGISSTGWATFLQAVVEAGYSVVGTWPLRTEMANRMIAAGTNALANSVVLVCRKKENTAKTVTRAEFIRALKRELPPAIAELQAANVSPADIPQSAIGPGMGIFSRYQAVLEADDNPMTVKKALQLINAELDEFLGGLQGEFDIETRFSVSWFELSGMSKGDFGVADNIARARGTSVDSVKHAGIVESADGQVRLLKRGEMDPDWDPETDDRLTVWECCQYIVNAYESSEYAAAEMIRRIGFDMSEKAKDLAYVLYEIAANKRNEAAEARAYNALVTVWPDLLQQAASINLADRDRQSSFNI
ncbi:DUF1156 domain-containing protein [Ruegeria lacuscaerulensis]|uniref:DUF1156 domain-containing protein n=1 Tax=Ruegeria lacuscaerulensis TaxID=55218 RepID=UPI0014816DB0|nr:DUF1156 domain-containing protein [Ruegeria lacuscaerulensis]